MRAGYPSETPAVTLGSPMRGEEILADVRVRLPLSTVNHHGLVAGATGTGKTKTLQVIAGQLGAPVRATVESFGPVLLAKVLDLNETQTAVPSLVFRFCDDRELPLLDLADPDGDGNDLLRDDPARDPHVAGSLRSVHGLLQERHARRAGHEHGRSHRRPQHERRNLHLPGVRDGHDEVLEHLECHVLIRTRVAERR